MREDGVAELGGRAGPGGVPVDAVAAALEGQVGQDDAGAAEGRAGAAVGADDEVDARVAGLMTRRTKRRRTWRASAPARPTRCRGSI